MTNPIRTFDQITARLRQAGRRSHIVVVCADDPHTQYAVLRALREGIARFTFVGDPAALRSCPELNDYAADVALVPLTDKDQAAREAVRMAREGEADILMKGLINTDNLLHAILNRDTGLLPRGRVLTHLAMAQLPGRDKLLFFSDAAVIPRPTLPQRIAMIGYAAQVCRSFGIDRPRIALIHCTEKVSEKFPHSLDYAEIARMARNGELGDLVVDGPMDVKTACDKEGGDIKGINSPIDGEADVLIFPNIEAGNVFYKSLALFAHADLAGLLQGTTCPVVLPSRADHGPCKYYSLIMACQSLNA